jgi:hypothetical protein
MIACQQRCANVTLMLARNLGINWQMLAIYQELHHCLMKITVCTQHYWDVSVELVN